MMSRLNFPLCAIRREDVHGLAPSKHDEAFGLPAVLANIMLIVTPTEPRRNAQFHNCLGDSAQAKCRA